MLYDYRLQFTSSASVLTLHTRGEGSFMSDSDSVCSTCVSLLSSISLSSTGGGSLGVVGGAESGD
jgi:hypothetical protein